MRLEDTRSPDLEGRTLELAMVLQQLWTYALTTKADLVRSHADAVAEAASRGFITTSVIPHGTLHGRLWKLTPAGLSFLFANADLIAHTQENAYVENHCG